MLSEAQKAQGKRKEAVDTLSQALEAVDQKDVIYVAVGELGMWYKQYDQAFQAFDIVAMGQNTIPSKELRFRSAVRATEALLLGGKIEQAGSYLVRVEEIDPGRIETEKLRARLKDIQSRPN